jgi:hypothetical protein
VEHWGFERPWALRSRDSLRASLRCGACIVRVRVAPSPVQSHRGTQRLVVRRLTGRCVRRGSPRASGRPSQRGAPSGRASFARDRPFRACGRSPHRERPFRAEMNLVSTPAGKPRRLRPSRAFRVPAFGAARQPSHGAARRGSRQSRWTRTRTPGRTRRSYSAGRSRRAAASRARLDGSVTDGALARALGALAKARARARSRDWSVVVC